MKFTYDGPDGLVYPSLTGVIERGEPVPGTTYDLPDEPTDGRWTKVTKKAEEK